MALDAETRDQLIDTVRRFVTERLVPMEAHVAETDQIPDDVVADMKELGLFGMSIPEAYSGMGLTMEEEVLAGFAVAQTSPAFRSLFATNNGIGAQGMACSAHRVVVLHHPALFGTAPIAQDGKALGPLRARMRHTRLQGLGVGVDIR